MIQLNQYSAYLVIRLQMSGCVFMSEHIDVLNSVKVPFSKLL